MVAGSILSALGTSGLIFATGVGQIFLCGIAMAIGSGSFAAANWALTTELAPPHEAGRFMGLANIGTAGGAAAAGLFGPLVDWRNHLAPGTGFTWLFLAASLAFLVSIVAARYAGEPASRLKLPKYLQKGPRHEI